MEWFAAHGHSSWATNAITELGVLRLLTNPAVTRHTVSSASALKALREATSHPNHVFWSLDRSAPQMFGDSSPRILGYKQWTDAALLRQAVERKGHLATFDKGYADIADSAARTHLTILGL